MRFFYTNRGILTEEHVRDLKECGVELDECDMNPGYDTPEDPQTGPLAGDHASGEASSPYQDDPTSIYEFRAAGEPKKSDGPEVVGVVDVDLECLDESPLPPMGSSSSGLDKTTLLRALRKASALHYEESHDLFELFANSGHEPSKAMNLVRAMENSLEKLTHAVQFDKISAAEKHASKLLAKNDIWGKYIPVELGGEFISE